MKNQSLQLLSLCAAFTGMLHGQGMQRAAAITGAGRADQGKCTIEVVVDIVAEIEIRGASGTLRNMAGQPAQWRRFECSSALPANPVNFAFKGIDGRGRQTLIRDPRNGGVAVVQIEDNAGGSEGYTFDLTWDARGQNYNTGGNDYPRGTFGNPTYAPGPNSAGGRDNGQYRRNQDEQYRPNYETSGYYRRYNHGFAFEEAVRVCQQEVGLQASRRFRRSDVHFVGRAQVDDNPGREDWVLGMIDVSTKLRSTP